MSVDIRNRKSLQASLNLWKRRVTYRRGRWNHWKKAKQTPYAKAQRSRWFGLLKTAKWYVERREAQLRNLTELRIRAYNEAAKLVGIMEVGGNNRGPAVEKIIREGGGLAGQPWCGWFCAAVYKRAGSKAVTWHWGAVRLLYPLSGVKRTTDPLRGDLVRFTFDHVGMFDKWVDRGRGVFQTIEGNTGRTGAVSDSKTGGDGVYIKQRNTSQVTDYLRVTR